MMLEIFRTALQTYARQQLLANVAPHEREALLGEARLQAAEVGASPLRVLQTNCEKSRCVILCDHPRYGRCVFKYVSGLSPSGLATAHTASLQRAHACGGSFLPDLFEVGPGYSLERFIEGSTLHNLPRQDWDDIDLPKFFETLRSFGAQDRENLPIGRDEATLIVFHFIRRALLAANYAVRDIRPWHVTAFARSREKQETLERLLDAAGRVTLPRSIVFVDLPGSNIMRETCSGRLFIVDIEHMKEGFFGFDALWLLAMLTRADHCPIEVLESAYQQMCTDTFTGVHGGGRLMQAMLAFLLDVLGGYVGRANGSAGIRRLRDRIEEDERRTARAQAGLQVRRPAAGPAKPRRPLVDLNGGGSR